MKTRSSSDFFSTLNDYFYEHKMTTNDCDVFEHTLLRLADIHILPQKSVFGISKENAEKITIKLKGLNANDAEKFITFLKKYDDLASKIDNFNGEANYYNFELHVETVLKDLFPLIQQEIERLEETNPELLEPYIKASKHACNTNNLFGDLTALSPISGPALAMYKLFYPDNFAPFTEDDGNALNVFIQEHNADVVSQNGLDNDKAEKPIENSQSSPQNLSPTVQRFKLSSNPNTFINQRSLPDTSKINTPDGEKENVSYKTGIN